MHCFKCMNSGILDRSTVDDHPQGKHLQAVESVEICIYSLRQRGKAIRWLVSCAKILDYRVHIPREVLAPVRPRPYEIGRAWHLSLHCKCLSAGDPVDIPVTRP